MGNRLTENKKRSTAALRATFHCPDCETYIEDDRGNRVLPGPDNWCDAHRCAAITRAGTRCRHAATYPDMGACGIHVAAAGDRTRPAAASPVPVTAEERGTPGPLVDRSFTAVRAALPPESVPAFDSQLAAIAHADPVDPAELDRFLASWHRIASRYVGDPEDWARMHQEAAELEAGTRRPGRLLSEVIAEQKARRGLA